MGWLAMRCREHAVEADLQGVFDRWARAKDERPMVAGAPEWLLQAMDHAYERSAFDTELGIKFRPDVLIQTPNEVYLIELKYGEKYEPIVLPQVLFEAHVLESHLGKFKNIVPVAVSQYSIWNRAALARLHDCGMRQESLRYLEVSLCAVGSRQLVWFEDPFAPWTVAEAPRELADLANQCRQWFRVGNTDTWFGTRRPLDVAARRPLFMPDDYVQVSRIHGDDAFAVWYGSPVGDGTYLLFDPQDAAEALPSPW